MYPNNHDPFQCPMLPQAWPLLRFQFRQIAIIIRYQVGTTSPPISPNNNRTNVLIPKHTHHIAESLKDKHNKAVTSTPATPIRLVRKGILLSHCRMRLPPAVLSHAVAPDNQQCITLPPPAVALSNAAPPDSQKRFTVLSVALTNAAPLDSQKLFTLPPVALTNVAPPDSQTIFTLLSVALTNAAPLDSQRLFTPPPVALTNAAPPDSQQVFILRHPPAVLSNTATPDSQRFINTLPHRHMTLPVPRIPGRSRRTNILPPTAMVLALGTYIKRVFPSWRAPLLSLRTEELK